jgi:oxygen-dependent protoporphyrinogen oxidase
MARRTDRPTKMKVVVVGAGIAGLSCAFKLKESPAFKAGLMTITVIEAGRRAGGIIETISEHGCLLESGPDSFITNKPYMLQLAERLGIGSHIISTELTNRGAMVVSKGRLVKLPEGFSLLAPTKILPFLESPIMSWPGKLRVLAEPFLPVRTSKEDESLANFVRRRFGQELLTKIAQAMVGGIYVGDAEKLSASMTAERFVALEQTAGSVIGGLMREAGAADSAGKSSNPTNGASTAYGAGGGSPGAAKESSEHGVRYGLFCTFDRGMSFLIDTLLRKLEGVDIRLATPVLSLALGEEISNENSNENARLDIAPSAWKVKLAQGEIEADQLVLAVPAKNAALLLKPGAPALSGYLFQVEAASSVVVNLVLDKNDISQELDAFGVVVPEVEMTKLGLSVIALSFASHKFKDRAPQGKLVVRAFLGGSKNRSMLERSDKELTDLVVKDLRKLLGYLPAAQPQCVRVCRWPESMPQFQVGHRHLLSNIDCALADFPSLSLAGASYRGVGLPECVRGGELCAEKILEAFTESHLVV